MIKIKKRAADHSDDCPIEKKSARNKFTNKSPTIKLRKSTAEKYAAKIATKPTTSNVDGKQDGSKFSKSSSEGKVIQKRTPVDGEKTDWRKFKQEKKQLKLKRKQAKDSYAVSVEAKQIYEKLKCRRTEKKPELVEKLYSIFGRNDVIKKLLMAHDTARIIQCMIKHASPSLRDQLSEKLLPYAVEMSVSKYSQFCILRMFKYGSQTIKSKLVDSFMGNIVRLAGHNISNKILDYAYHTVASPKQRIYMRQEFYGELYRKTKDESVKTLADTYKEADNMKMPILGAVKSVLDHLANKMLVDNSLVHAVILEYLKECQEEKIEETVSAFTPLIPLMLTTKDGSQAAIICFYKSSPKNRRAIIKTIKEHLIKICTHEHGHIFMVALLNSLDDTKAIKKAIYDNLHPKLEILMANQWGRRVIEWLVAPADTNCFHPTFITGIEYGLQYGKKDKDARRREIFEQIEEPMASAIAEHPQFWLSNRHIGLVTAEILKKLGQEHFEKAAQALARVVVDPAWAVSVEEAKYKSKRNSHDTEKIITEATKVKKQKRLAANPEGNVEYLDEDEEEILESDSTMMKPQTTTILGIEESGMHIVLKKIIKNDKHRLQQNEQAQTFGSLLTELLAQDTLKYWMNVNRACFILLNIFEQSTETTKLALKTLLKPHQTTLEKQDGPGAKLLRKNLDNLI